MAKRVLVVLSEGFEDIEAVSVIDVLNRCGVEVTVASLRPGPVEGAYGTTLAPDLSIDEVEGEFDGIAFPGGKKNAQNLAAHPKVIELIRNHNRENRLVAAICAAPGHVLAEAAGILKGRDATGDPVFNDKLAAGGAIITDAAVTSHGNIITGMGPGAALEFALRLAEYLVGPELPATFAEKWRMKQ
jgi:4-methyl-5(b-hydroxyethyl)-thiazole monophosphate biosynthesis